MTDADGEQNRLKQVVFGFQMMIESLRVGFGGGLSQACDITAKVSEGSQVLRCSIAKCDAVYLPVRETLAV